MPLQWRFGQRRWRFEHRRLNSEGAMNSEILELMQTKIAFLERANAELGDVVCGGGMKIRAAATGAFRYEHGILKA
jgi:hypothetical protein